MERNLLFYEIEALTHLLDGEFSHWSQQRDFLLPQDRLDVLKKQYSSLMKKQYAKKKDANYLTDVVFFAIHPDLNGRKLLKSDPEPLKQEWIDLRKQLILPFIKMQTKPDRKSSGTGISLPKIEQDKFEQRVNDVIQSIQIMVEQVSAQGRFKDVYKHLDKIYSTFKKMNEAPGWIDVLTSIATGMILGFFGGFAASKLLGEAKGAFKDGLKGMIDEGVQAGGESLWAKISQNNSSSDVGANSEESTKAIQDIGQKIINAFNFLRTYYPHLDAQSANVLYEQMEVFNRDLHYTNPHNSKFGRMLIAEFRYFTSQMALCNETLLPIPKTMSFIKLQSEFNNKYWSVFKFDTLLDKASTNEIDDIVNSPDATVLKKISKKFTLIDELMFGSSLKELGKFYERTGCVIKFYKSTF